MKHLKRYNEELGTDKFKEFGELFKKVELTPPVDKIHVSKLYKKLIIELDREIEFTEVVYGVGKVKSGKFISIDVSSGVGDYKDYMKICPNLDSCAKSSMSSIFAGYSDWEGFKDYWGSSLVSLWDYNDTNVQEIENMLSEWEVSVENIWAVLA